MDSRRTFVIVALVALVFVGLLMWKGESGATSALPAPPTRADAPDPVAEKRELEKPLVEVAEPVKPEERAPPPETARTLLPQQPKNAAHKQWVHGTYGPAQGQLGKYKNEADEYTPQGFVVTPDGKLIVLDTGKKRVLWYSPEGKIEREMTLPADAFVAPADVALSKDGTLVVMDHIKGIVLFDQDGKKRAVLPKIPDEDAMTGMYTVNNDVMVTAEGMSTVKAGDTTGVPDDEVPGVHRQEEDGRIPGHVAPDGKTILSAGFDDRDKGDFWVTSIKGSPGEEVFTRFFHAPGVTGLPFIQADDAGRIYLVVNTATTFALICLDGKTGAPVGMVEMPPQTGEGGRQFRAFSVSPTGGLVYQVANDPKSVTYEWFNCH